MNIPKAIRSLKSNGFLSISTTPILCKNRGQPPCKLIIGNYFYIRTSWCIISEIPFSIWCLIKTCILSIGGKAIRDIRYYITIESGILYISKPSTICLLHLSCFYIGNISQNLIDGILVVGSKIISLRLLQFDYGYRVYILCIRRI